jgi:ankyrin repeat protein
MVAIEVTLNNYPHLIHEKDDDGLTCLHRAAKGGHFQLVRRLLEIDPALLELRTAQGHTACVCAARHGRTLSVQALVAAKCNLRARDHHGLNAVAWSARNGHAEVLATLIAHLPSAHGVIEEFDSKGDSPLLHAARCGHLPCVRLLVQARADPSQCNRAGHNAYTLSSEHTHSRTVRVIFRKYDLKLSNVCVPRVCFRRWPRGCSGSTLPRLLPRPLSHPA